MTLFTLLVFSVGFAAVYSLNCDDVSGDWQNELGSHMTLNVDDSNKISGEYYTAVETRPEAAAYVSNVTGFFSKQSDGAILAFSVLFNHGFSLATWVGQCMVCDGKEVLHTTYTLRRYAADHRERWAAIVTNQNTFWRIEDESENAIESLTTNFPPIRSRSTVSQKPPGGLELNGKWKSSDNEEIEFLGENKAILEGRTTCCHLSGKHHTTELVGRKDGNEMFTAATFMSTSSMRIKSWTGHIYEASPSTSKILEASWLEHEFNPSCTNGRNSVKFGIQKFTRISPNGVGRSESGSRFLDPENIGKIKHGYREVEYYSFYDSLSKLSQILEFENIEEKPETFLDKIRKFFTNMF